MFADWNFHQLLFLLEVLKAQTTLLLISHVAELLLVLSFLIVRLRVDSAILDSIHDLEVDPNDGLCLVVQLIVVKLAIAVTATLTASSCHVLTPLLRLCEEEAYHLNKDYQEEDENRPWEQDHDYSVRQVVIL